jgi:uncharacterized membrane protein YsdA (DUF1294 family)
MLKYLFSYSLYFSGLFLAWISFRHLLEHMQFVYIFTLVIGLFVGIWGRVEMEKHEK